MASVADKKHTDGRKKHVSKTTYKQKIVKFIECSKNGQNFVNIKSMIINLSRCDDKRHKSNFEN